MEIVLLGISQIIFISNKSNYFILRKYKREREIIYIKKDNYITKMSLDNKIILKYKVKIIFLKLEEFLKHIFFNRDFSNFNLSLK